jgi:16S rRNA processing protein RimM
MAADATVGVGRIAGAFGVRGWVKLMSFTDPAENLVHYPDWRLRQGGDLARPVEHPVELTEWRWQSDRLVGHLRGVDDRDRALALVGAEIVVPRHVLPPVDDGWYWADLLGFDVVNLSGVTLGQLTSVLDNGAQDVMVLQGAGRERLVPFVRGRFVHRIDEVARQIIVDWHEDD